MLFHVEMTVKIPHDLEVNFVNELKAKEKAMSQDLQRSGKWVDIWRIVGKYSNISIFNVESPAELHYANIILLLKKENCKLSNNQKNYHKL